MASESKRATLWVRLAGILAGLGLAFLCGAAAAQDAPASAAETPKPAQPEKAAGDKTALADTKTALPEPDRIPDQEEVIIIGGQPTPGRLVLPCTETEFRFKLKDTGDVLALRWADLPEDERKRVQKLYGMEVRDDKLVFGDKITGVKLLLKSGKAIKGLPVPERARPGKVVLRTAAAQAMEVAENEIESKENYEAYESEYFSATEVYQKRVLAKPPGDKDAPAHLEMAQWCAKIGLYSTALQHLAMAKTIDPQMGERNKDLEAQIQLEDAKQRVNSLYLRMVSAMNGQDYITAGYILDQLDRNFPNSEMKTRWEGLRPKIEAGMKTDLVRKVIMMSYTVASDLIQRRLGSKVRVDEKGNPVPTIPGKQVTTRHGLLFRGTLVSGEAGQDMVLMCGDKGEEKVTIAAKEVMEVQDIDLAKSFGQVNQTWDELKEYVADANRPDGLKMQMVAKISGYLKEAEAKVKEIFDTRLAREAKVDDQGLYTRTSTYVTLHDAYYGLGSWLREGSRPAPLTEAEQANLQNNQRGQRNRGGVGQNQWRRGLGANDLQRRQRQNDPQEDPNLTDDPAVWWSAQTYQVQYNTLMAIAAEKVFAAKQVIEMQCSNCRGTGFIEVLGAGGNLEPHRCPQCRGMGKWFRIQYR